MRALATGARQPTMWGLLDDIEFGNRQAERLIKLLRGKRLGPRDRKGNLKSKGSRFTFCAHPNCGGFRRCWPYKRKGRTIMVCQRDWRTRRRIWDDQLSMEERYGR